MLKGCEQNKEKQASRTWDKGDGSGYKESVASDHPYNKKHTGMCTVTACRTI